MRKQVQEAIDAVVLHACRSIDVPDCVTKLEFDDASFTFDALSLVITVLLKPEFKYIGGKKPIIHIDDGASLSNGIDGSGALLSKTSCTTESKLIALVTKAMKILARDAKKSKSSK